MHSCNLSVVFVTHWVTPLPPSVRTSFKYRPLPQRALMEEIQQLLAYDLVNFQEPFVMVWEDCDQYLAEARWVWTYIMVITSNCNVSQMQRKYVLPFDKISVQTRLEGILDKNRATFEGASFLWLCPVHAARNSRMAWGQRRKAWYVCGCECQSRHAAVPTTQRKEQC